MAQFRDVLLTGIAFGLPAYVVFRSRRFGVPLGAGTIWLLVFLCGEISPTCGFSPPQDHRAAAVQEWIMGGWVYGFVYCSLVWLLKQGLIMLRRGFFIYQQEIKPDFTSTVSFLQIWRELNQTPNGEISQNHLINDPGQSLRM